MRADEIIDAIISRHEEESSKPVPILDGLRLEPMLDYGGKMA